VTRRAQIFGIPDDDAALRSAVDLARDMHWRWRYGVDFAERDEAKHNNGLLGHANVGFLLETYAHVLKNDGRHAAEQAASFLIAAGWDPESDATQD
jgi:hypothetical protein